MPKLQPEVERLVRELDKIIVKYSKISDPRVSKVVRRLKRAKDKIDSGEATDKVFKLLVIADKLQDWFNRLL